jgi:hypothetical protein
VGLLVGLLGPEVLWGAAVVDGPEPSFWPLDSAFEGSEKQFPMASRRTSIREAVVRDRLKVMETRILLIEMRSAVLLTIDLPGRLCGARGCLYREIEVWEMTADHKGCHKINRQSGAS